jgi:prepilin-type N-terminal cleavage/methylation domain-containing protein
MNVRGFTFVEVLAALAFLAILAPVVMKGLAIANRAGVVSERSGLALQLAENQLNEALLMDTWRSGDASGDFAPDHPGYRWELSHGEWAADAMGELTMTVFFQVQGREHDVRLTTLADEQQGASAQ